MSTPIGPAPVKLNRTKRERLRVNFRFLTYVFGGGVTHNNDESNLSAPSRPFDPVTPIRPPSIRGALRYWWRATCGVRLENFDAMRRKEAEIWGAIWDGTPQHSKVSVSVNNHQLKTPSPVPVFGWRGGGRFPKPTKEALDLGYGAFPLRPDGNNGMTHDSRSALWDYGQQEVKLLIDTPLKFVDDIGLALSAWLTLGGYGARTRRGFGAIGLKSCSHPKEVVTDDLDQLGKLLEVHSDIPVNDIPTVIVAPDRYRRGAQCKTPLQAHRDVLATFRTFRQGEDVGRNLGQGENVSGRSRWPEPDAIREITGLASPLHRTPINSGDAFPRANFGLPIIFHFNDKDDPADQSLQISDATDRFPSPLILRPTADGRPLAFWMSQAIVPKDIYLKDIKTRLGMVVQKSVFPPRYAALPHHQQRLLDPNPIEAFFTFFDSRLKR